MNNLRHLTDLRNSYGVTQGECADLLGISSKSLWLYENDSSKIPDDVLEKIMLLFDISYDQIFLGKKYDFFVYKKNWLHGRASELDFVAINN